MTVSRTTAVLVIGILAMKCASPTGAGPRGEPTAAGGDTVRGIADAYWDLSMRRSPEWATFLGDHRFDDRLADLSEGARERFVADLRALSARLEAIEPSGLAEQDRLTRDALAVSLRDGIEEHAHGLHLWSVDALSGPQVDFPQLVQFHPKGTPEHCGNLLARYRAFPAQVGQHRDSLAAGLSRGLSAARVNVERVIAQVRAMLVVPVDDDPLAATARACGHHVQAMIAEVRERIRPALAAFADFLEARARPAARVEVGIHALPGGRDAYRFLVRLHTGEELEPEALHDLGLREVARIRERMAEVARRLAPGGAGEPRGAAADLLARPEQRGLTRERLLELNRAALARAQARLPEMFGRLPSIGCEVRPLESFREKDAPAAYYYPAPDDGSRPGIYYVNTYRPETRSLHNLEALAFHEAVPGHHLQVAVARELSGLPDFRRHGMFTAYVEGWALYAEALAEEAGWYSGDEALFGRYGFEAWRAARLVVDTGMHALGWSRARAVAYLAENATVPSGEIENEVDRYIAWPGQALAYKVGELAIRDLRRAAEQRLGVRFDARAFHDALLGTGALPLPVLRAHMGRWIEEQARPPAAPVR